VVLMLSFTQQSFQFSGSSRVISPPANRESGAVDVTG
jgi:hypothetical protein